MRAAGSVASTVSTAPGPPRVPLRPARSPAAGSAGRGVHSRRSQPGRPELGPQVGDASGSSARNRSTSASGPGRALQRQRTRTLPWVSTPIASSTWLGRSVEEVHADPDATAKPRRSSAVTSASPSTYRQEKVTRCGSRSRGSPTTSASGIAAAVARIRSTRAAARACSAARVASDCCQASAAARAQGDHRLGVGAPGLPLVRPGTAPAGALAHHQHPDAAGAAPRARVADEHVVRRGHRLPAQRRHRVHQQRHTLGQCPMVHRRQRLAGADLAVGTLHRGGGRARPGQGALERVQVDPPQGVHPHLLEQRRVARRGGEVAAEGQDPGVLDRRRDEPGPRRRPACISPSHPARRATGPEGRKDNSGGRTPSPAATTSRARSSSARADDPRRAAAAGRPIRRRVRPAACRGQRAAEGCWRRRAGPGGPVWREWETHADGSPTLKPVQTRRWSRVCAVGSTSKLEGAHLASAR